MTHVPALLFLVVLLATLGYVFYRSKRKPTAQVGGVTAFAKIASADLKAKEAEGKIIAVKAVAKAQQETASALKDAAKEAHAGLDDAHSALDEVHAVLG